MDYISIFFVNSSVYLWPVAAMRSEARPTGQKNLAERTNLVLLQSVISRYKENLYGNFLGAPLELRYRRPPTSTTCTVQVYGNLKICRFVGVQRKLRYSMLRPHRGATGCNTSLPVVCIYCMFSVRVLRTFFFFFCIVSLAKRRALSYVFVVPQYSECFIDVLSASISAGTCLSSRSPTTPLITLYTLNNCWGTFCFVFALALHFFVCLPSVFW